MKPAETKFDIGKKYKRKFNCYSNRSYGSGRWQKRKKKYLKGVRLGSPKSILGMGRRE